MTRGLTPGAKRADVRSREPERGGGPEAGGQPGPRNGADAARLDGGIPRLLELLVTEAALTIDQAREAAAEQRKSGERLVSVLKRLGVLGEQDLLEFLSRKYRIPIVGLTALDVHADVVRLVKREIAYRYHVCPISRKGDTLTLALSDPTGASAIDDVRFATGLRVIPVLASESAIRVALETYYHRDYLGRIDALLRSDPQAPAEAIEFAERARKKVDISELEALSGDAPVVRLVNLVLADAIAKRASDIHLEPGEDAFHVRYRIDGVLHDMMAPPKPMEAAILSRVKIMAQLDIAERRLPQDGRITATFADREIDLRVSSLPTIFGESIVLRILDKSRVVLDLAQLGFEADDLDRVQRAIRAPHGMILVTGPTGSGKSTTLYAAVASINSPEINILTAEDPVEFKLPRIKQVQVREDIGLTFTAALRSFLRQDPDVILIGEMRDAETTQIAIRAALTGHLVFSTLHTNDAASTITRLLDMEVAPFLVSSSLRLVLAQRLCRQICRECRVRAEVPAPVLVEAGFTAEDVDRLALYRGTGCATCAETGYRGRTVISEILDVTPELQEAIVHRRPARELKEIAVSQGMRTLRAAGLRKVGAGITTIEELMRVTYGH